MQVVVARGALCRGLMRAMSASRTTRRAVLRFASWLAIVAMALNALWPLVANARPASSGPGVEVCAAGGVQRTPIESGGTQAPELALSPHCAFCAFGADRAAAPSLQATLSVPAAGTLDARSPAATAVCVECFSYFSAPPRAPPFSA